MKRGTILNYCIGTLSIDTIVENEKDTFERV